MTEAATTPPAEATAAVHVPTSVPTPAPSAFVAAVDRSPRGGAAAARLRAASAAAEAAGVLPQPAIEVWRMRSPGMGQNGTEFDIFQDLPRWGERKAARSMAAADIQMAAADHDATRGEIAAMAATMIVEAAAADHRAALLREAAGQARILSETMVNAAGAGKGGIPEALALRTRADGAEVMASDADRDAADMRENARAVLGLALDAQLPDAQLPGPEQVDARGGAMAAVARARQRLADAQSEDAASLGHPDVMLEGRWYRMGDPQADIYSLGLRIGLPVHRSPANAGIAAAQERQRAGVLDEQGERLRARQLRSRAAHALAQRATERTFAASATVRLQAELDSFISKLGIGSAETVINILDRFDQLRDIRLQVIEMDLVADRALADLWMVVPWPTSAASVTTLQPSP